MAQTAKPSLLTQYLIGLAKDNADVLGLADVFYGDQEYVPKVPSLCIEPATVERELNGTSMRTQNKFVVACYFYFADMQSGLEAAQAKADTKAEAVIEVFNIDGMPAAVGGTQYGGLVMYGYVNNSTYGYKVKENKVLRANRFLVYAESLTSLLEA